MSRKQVLVKRLTRRQRDTLDGWVGDLTRVICSEVVRRIWARPYLDDVLQDACTRTCEAVAKNRLKTKDRITARARSCGLDALKTLARRVTKPMVFETALLTDRAQRTIESLEQAEGSLQIRKDSQVWAVVDGHTGHLVAASFGWAVAGIGPKRVFEVTQIKGDAT